MGALMGDFWVFGYGSLIWNPGFEFVEKQKSRLNGYHRSLCMESWVHRGTRENPGLILGLDQGGECEGISMLVEASKRADVIGYLRERELVTDVYKEIWVDVELYDGSLAPALTYKVDVTHDQYVGQLPIEEQYQIIRTAQGKSGKNVDYVRNTAKGHYVRPILPTIICKRSTRCSPNRQASDHHIAGRKHLPQAIVQ